MRRHTHYFKDVVHLTEIDVYRVCDIFDVQDASGATQHALKKLLLPGQRGGGKSIRKDYQEALDTIARRIEMMDEDEAALIPPSLCGFPLSEWPVVVWWWMHNGAPNHMPTAQTMLNAYNNAKEKGTFPNTPGLCTRRQWVTFFTYILRDRADEQVNPASDALFVLQCHDIAKILPEE